MDDMQTKEKTRKNTFSAAKGRYILFIAGIPLIFDAISHQMQMSVWRSNNKNDANSVEHFFFVSN